MSDPRPDYIGQREGALAFLQRETTIDLTRLKLYLSFSQGVGKWWPYWENDAKWQRVGVIVWVKLRDEARFEIILERGHGKPSPDPPGVYPPAPPPARRHWAARSRRRSAARGNARRPPRSHPQVRCRPSTTGGV
jgi:hypothetical protein